MLAAGHLELVLAEDYNEAGNSRDALRCRLSAASCFWMGGESPKARLLFDETRVNFPAKANVIDATLAELERDYPRGSKKNVSRKKS